MQGLTTYIIIITIIVVTLTVLYSFYFVFYYYLFAPISYAYYRSFPKPLPQQYLQPIQEFFPYYQRLSRQNQQKFENRVAHFIANKTFVPREMQEVTPEMKALIAASAIEISFGFKRYLFEDFYKIFVYPENFHYRDHKNRFRGFVSDRGVIALSWRTFLDDYKVYNDGINLGLHELAHAMKLEKLEINMDFSFYDNMEEWLDVAKEQMVRVQQKRSNTFRKRGGANNDEFFAVAVEGFFEIPEKMRERHPVLYDRMCQLMNQDPTIPQEPVLSRQEF